MKHSIIGLFLIISISGFSQAKRDTTGSGKPIPTPTPVVIRSFYDTIKVKIIYEDNEYLKITKGFAVRQIETDSSNPEKPRLLSSSLFDEKMKPFKKTVFNITQVQ